jgi:hypothetical protein
MWASELERLRTFERLLLERERRRRDEWKRLSAIDCTTTECSVAYEAWQMAWTARERMQARAKALSKANSEVYDPLNLLTGERRELPIERKKHEPIAKIGDVWGLDDPEVPFLARCTITQLLEREGIDSMWLIKDTKGRVSGVHDDTLKYHDDWKLLERDGVPFAGGDYGKIKTGEQ